MIAAGHSLVVMVIQTVTWILAVVVVVHCFTENMQEILPKLKKCKFKKIDDIDVLTSVALSIIKGMYFRHRTGDENVLS